MKNSIKSIRAEVVQMGDTITNSGPLVSEIRVLRQRIDDAIAAGDVSEDGAAVLESAVTAAEAESKSDSPQRSRLNQILGGITAATSGLTATAGLTEAVHAVLNAVSGAE